MIDWGQIKSTSQALIADLSGLGHKAVRWQDEAKGTVWGDVPIIFLRVSSLGPLGVDEERRDDHGADDQTVTVAGQRRFTLSIRCESFTEDIQDLGYSSSVLETIQTRLKRSSSLERYRGVFAIQEWKPIAKFNYTNQGRQVSASVLDLVCLTVNNDRDDTLAAGSWISEALVTGSVKDSTGTVLGTIQEDVRTR